MPFMPQPYERKSAPAFGAAVAAAALVAGLSGCATGSRTVKVDAFANPEAAPAFSYALASADPARPSRDVHYTEIVQQVNNALYQRGLFEAPDPASADMVVLIDYGEHPPQTKVTTVSQPVLVSPDPLATASGMGTLPSIQTGAYPGQYPSNRTQVVMAQTTRVTQTSEKYLTLTARENTKPGARGQKTAGNVWAVEATVEDEESSVYECIPAMLEATLDYIGTSTGGQQKVTVNLPPSS